MSDDYKTFPVQFHRNFVQRYLELPLLIRCMQPPRVGRILEVGCGPLNVLPALCSSLSAASAHGLDIDEALLRQGQRQALPHYLYCVTGDVRAMPFENCAFDCIFDFGTLYHISEHDQGLQEIARVLAPDGVFIFESALLQRITHPLRNRSRRVRLEAGGFRITHSSPLWSAARLIKCAQS